MDDRAVGQQELARVNLEKARQDLALVETVGDSADLSVLYLQVEDAGLIPPATIDSLEELTGFAVQFRYTLLTTPALDRDAKTRLAAELIAWADAIVEQSPPPSNLHDNG